MLTFYSAGRISILKFSPGRSILIPALSAFPKISVITVVRNGMPFVAQTIDSVLAQEYRPLEYIVVDGGSVDGTVDIIKSKQSGITRWISEKDDGIADAFNKGLALASGDYILFLNADDALANTGVLAAVASQVVKYEFPAFIYGDCDVLDRNSGEILYRAEINFSHSGLRRGRMPPHPSLFSKRGYFEKYGNFDKRFKMAMDFEWFLRGIRNERIVHAPLLVTNVRTGGISTLHQSSAVDEIVQALRKNGYLASQWDKLRIKGYFLTRTTLKILLKGLGAYDWFARFKKK